MARYEYKALTPNGERVGEVIADDEAAARRQLEANGWIAIDLLWCPVSDERGNLRDDEVQTLVQAVGSAAENRLPLEVTLAVLADEEDDPRLADAAQRLATQLKRGVPLEQAIAQFDEQLPAEVQGLMKVGIESGDLAGTFEQFTRERMAMQRIRTRIRTASAYPLLIAAILIPLLLFLSVYVIPSFGETYKDFEIEVQPVTLVTLQTAEQIPGLVAGLLAIIVIVPILIRILGGQWLYHRIRAATPILGRLWMWSGQREFASTLASFLELRLPLPTAVGYTAQMLSDRNVARACRRVVTRLDGGESLSASMAHSIHFDRALVALARWGEGNGVLPDALRIAADVIEDRLEQQAALVRRLLPPIVFVAVATMMIFIVVGLMLPLVELIRALSM
jgi:type II secretory pathway component PulF